MIELPPAIEPRIGRFRIALPLPAFNRFVLLMIDANLHAGPASSGETGGGWKEERIRGSSLPPFMRYDSTMTESGSAPPGRDLDELVDQLVANYQSDERTQHLDATFLPNRDRTVALIELLRQLLFPGFFDEQRITSANIRWHTGELLTRMHGLLYEQVRQALRYDLNRTEGQGKGDDCDGCDQWADDLTRAFLGTLPELRRKLALDVQAAYEGDPAAISTDETIFCYPGVDAIMIHRIAYELFQLEVPLLPRIMSEYAHNETGIDIHPGARIGESFFIDHGTGVVIGETCIIGDRVKLYQGVTLGALSTKGGQAWRGRKRHPTIENDVTIYGGAIILGGETVIGEGATIGGAVFLTAGVPAHHTVLMKKPELRVSANKQAGRGDRAAGEKIVREVPSDLDFQI